MADKELVEYFISQTNERFKSLEKKVDTLLQFKWQIIGGAGVVSIIMTFVIQFVLYIINTKVT